MINKWFPRNPTLLSRTNEPNNPRARLLCFHGAGSDSTIFTSKGTPNRPSPNLLLTYCIENGIELLAVHLPGRTSRYNEVRIQSAAAIAENILDLLESTLTPTKSTKGLSYDYSEEPPLVIAGHSMGAICAYEFACLLRARCGPTPKHLILSCMVSPDTPLPERGWPPECELNSLELQEECRAWGSNAEIFSPDVWRVYEPILRDDFKIIDTYSFTEPSKVFRRLAASTASTSPSGSPLSASRHLESFHAPLGISSTIFFASEDKKIPQNPNADKWKRVIMGADLFSTSPSGFGTKKNQAAEFKVQVIPDATHNFFYDPKARSIWMQTTTEILDRILIDAEYGY